MRVARAYLAPRILGGIAGTMTAHAMFGQVLVEASVHIRTGGAQWFSEGVATFGLLAVILAGLRFERKAVPWLVGLYITAAYWFTASTSFANPAVAVARSLTNSFSGIRPADLPGFILAEIAGALIAAAAMRWLLTTIATTGEADHDRHHLSQPRLRDVAQHARYHIAPAVKRLSSSSIEKSAIARTPGRLLKAMDMPARALLREKGTPYAELGLRTRNGARRS